MRRKRVLYLAPSTGYGGAETFLQQTAKYHGRVDALYLCFRPGPLTEALRAHGREAYVLGQPPRLRDPRSVLRAVAEIARFVRDHDVDLIHSTMAYAALFGALAAARTARKHVWFQHGPVSGWLDRFAAWLPSELVYVNSRHTRAAQGKLNPRRALRTITLGVDQDRVARVQTNAREITRAQWGVSPDTFLIGTVCRPQPQKGLELFVRAVSALENRGERAVKAVILGASAEPTPYEQSILALIRELGAPVILVPAQSNALERMPAFDLVVSAAVAPEGFGLTLVEAMALGIPTAGPGEGGPLDILENGRNGYLFRPRDLAHLTETMLAVLRLPERERAELGRRGAADVHDRFLAERAVRAVEASYEEILTNH